MLRLQQVLFEYLLKNRKLSLSRFARLRLALIS